jgi:molybdopterin/thiamine biosynthesis adenylyltransferase
MSIKNIGIAGAGGIGAYLTQFLFDYGVNRNQYPWTEYTVDLYDDDVVDVGNLLHQNFKEDDIGKFKANVVSEKCFVTPQIKFMTKEDFSKYNLIFSCVDSMSFRKQLYEYSWEHPELVWIDGRCNSRNIGIYNSKIPKSKLLSTITDDDKRGGCLREIDKQNKVSHATPLIVAGMMTQLFINHLRNEMVAAPIQMIV